MANNQIKGIQGWTSSTSSGSNSPSQYTFAVHFSSIRQQHHKRNDINSTLSEPKCHAESYTFGLV
eukprot:5621666-Amphidinium_carterae.1